MSALGALLRGIRSITWNGNPMPSRDTLAIVGGVVADDAENGQTVLDVSGGPTGTIQSDLVFAAGASGPAIRQKTLAAEDSPASVEFDHHNLQIRAGFRAPSTNGEVHVQTADGSTIAVGSAAAPTAPTVGRWTVQRLVAAVLELGFYGEGPTVSFGTADPTTNPPNAPNGSVYLKTDGGQSTTLYVRAGGIWYPK